MNAELLATFLFWSIFVVSAGPFWTATMAAATTTSFPKLYKDYILYLIFGWFPLITFISILVWQLGSLSPNLTIILHFVGAMVVFWMAYKIYRSVPGKSESFNFDWKAMSLLSWTNPKVWILIPIGFLGAGITNSMPLNIFLYYIIGIPIFLVGVFAWGMVGRIGAKISLTHVNKFNSFLMAMFGVFLLYSGWQLVLDSNLSG